MRTLLTVCVAGVLLQGCAITTLESGDRVLHLSDDFRKSVLGIDTPFIDTFNKTAKTSAQPTQSVTNPPTKISQQTTTIDWTPYIKSVTENCNGQDIYRLFPHYDYDYSRAMPAQIPQILHPSIVQHGTSEEDGTEFILLKNAIFFGQPLVKIEVAEEGDGDGLTLTFANEGFMTLIPQFTVNDGKRMVALGTPKYWINEFSTNEENENKRILATHDVLLYHKDADEDLMQRYSAVLLNYKPHNKASKQFIQHQQPILNKLVKNHKKLIKEDSYELHRHEVESYKIHQTGYQKIFVGSGGNYSKNLFFDKKSKTISCFGAYGFGM